MEKLKIIKQLNDKDLDEYIENRIEKLEKEVQNDEQLVLGFDIDYNPISVEIRKLDNADEFDIYVRNNFSKYIPKNSKMVYAMYYNENDKTVFNGGQYYYIDDDSYIKDFCNYIKDKEITNSRELFDYIFDFIEEYFGKVKYDDRKRVEFNSLILKNEKTYFPPIEEHKLSKFKKSTYAECTEIAILAQNILQFLGYESCIVIGNIKYSDEEEASSHAFNLVSYKSEKTGEQVNLLVDFSSSVYVHDINLNKRGLSPFIGELDKSIKDSIIDLYNPKQGISFENYSYIIFGNSILRWIQEVDRKYSISYELKQENDIISKKEKENNNEKVYTYNYNIR